MYSIQNLRSLGIFLGLVIAISASAQRSRVAVRAYSRTASDVVQKYKKAIARSADSAVEKASDSTDVTLSPYLYKLIGPGIYYRSALSSHFGLEDTLTQYPTLSSADFFDYRQRLNASIDDVLFHTYSNRPDLFFFSIIMIRRLNLSILLPLYRL